MQNVVHFRTQMYFDMYCCAGECSAYPNFTVGFVHIDDVISSHILAMEDGRVTGRLVCSNSVAHWSEIVEMLKANYPSYPITDK